MGGRGWGTLGIGVQCLLPKKTSSARPHYLRFAHKNCGAATASTSISYQNHPPTHTHHQPTHSPSHPNKAQKQKQQQQAPLNCYTWTGFTLGHGDCSAWYRQQPLPSVYFGVGLLGSTVALLLHPRPWSWSLASQSAAIYVGPLIHFHIRTWIPYFSLRIFKYLSVCIAFGLWCSAFCFFFQHAKKQIFIPIYPYEREYITCTEIRY